jgi:molybdopterin converting factor small subunit
MIRVVLPAHLRQLARCDHEISVDAEPTQRAVLDAVEQQFPMLRGTLRDTGSGRRRDFVRFFACGEDLSHDEPDDPLPEPVARGSEPFRVVGAMAGG